MAICYSLTVCPWLNDLTSLEGLGFLNAFVKKLKLLLQILPGLRLQYLLIWQKFRHLVGKRKAEVLAYLNASSSPKNSEIIFKHFIQKFTTILNISMSATSTTKKTFSSFIHLLKSSSLSHNFFSSPTPNIWSHLILRNHN